MTPDVLARLHAACFDRTPRPWTEREFRDLMATSGVALLTEPGGRGFVLFRNTGPEAEILTLCTDPVERRTGIARRLLDAMHDELVREGVKEVFLEVAESNTAAVALYLGAGYRKAGYRKDYYDDGGKAHVSALVLVRRLDRDATDSPQNAK